MSSGAEQVYLESRPHGIVLVRPLALALALVLGGVVVLFLAWPAPLAGAAATGIGALLGAAEVTRWDRTRLVVTTEKVLYVHGVLRRRASAVMLGSVRTIGLEQTVTGRALGYGTLHAGSLEVRHVPHAKQVCRLVERLCA